VKAQNPPPDEVIVIDDQSRDTARSVVEEEKATVIVSQPLPAGWTGKTWACYQCARQATVEILIFLDTDTMMEENGLKLILNTYFPLLLANQLRVLYTHLPIYIKTLLSYNSLCCAQISST